MSCRCSLRHTWIYSQLFLVHGVTVGDLWKASSRLFGLSIAASCVICVFICHGATEVNTSFLFETWKWATETYKMVITIYLQLYHAHVFEQCKRFGEGCDVLKDDWMRSSPQLFKICKLLQMFVNWRPETISLSKNWWRMNCTLTKRKLFMKICVTARYVWSLFGTVLLMSSLFHDDDDDDDDSG